MKIDQTVENHDDLLKVVDNLLSEAGLDRKNLNGNVTFAGLDPIRETVLKVGACGATSGVANAIASALLYQERTGKGQDIHCDLRKAWADQGRLEDITVDCTTVNGRSRMVALPKFGEAFHILPTRDKRFVMVCAIYPSQFLKQSLIFNSGYTLEQLSASSIKHTADELEAMGNSAMIPITKIRTEAEFQASEQWANHISTPIIHIEKIGDSAPEPLPAGDRPLSGIRSLSMVHVVAGPHAQSTLSMAGADCLNIHPPGWYEHEALLLSSFCGIRHAALEPKKDKAEILKLVRDADIFLENLRPGLADREGYSAQQLAEIRPGIIYGTIKLNVPGPYSQMPGFDYSAGAISGLLTRTGTPDAPATPNAVNSINDLMTGRHLATGIQAALLRRAREGGSYRVSCALAQTCTWILSLGLVPKRDLLDIKSLGPDHQWKKPNLQSGKTGYGDTTVIADQTEMSLTPARYPDPIASYPGSSYPVWLPR